MLDKINKKKKKIFLKKIEEQSQKIENYLDKVQSNKIFSVDIGVDENNKRVNYSQKKIIAINKLNKDEFKKEIENLNYSDKIKFYSIDKFVDIKKDFKDDIDKGIDGGVLFIKKNIIDNIGNGLGSKPGIKGLKENGINFLLDIYPDIITILVNQINNIFTDEDIFNLKKKIIRGIDNYGGEYCFGCIYNKETKEIIDKDLFLKEREKYIKEGFIFINLERIIGKKAINVIIDNYKYYVRNNNGVLEEKTMYEYGKYMYSKEYNKNNDYSFLEKNNTKKNIKENDNIDNSNKTIQEILKFGRNNNYDFEKEDNKYLRIGFEYNVKDLDFKNIEDVKDKMFNDYGINKLNFGNTLSDKIAKEKIKQLIESFEDLKNILGFDIKYINNYNKLSIGFAVSSGLGKKSKQIAHYDPNQTFINFFKKGLNGNFAHEYFHFIDNALFKMFGLETINTKKGDIINNLSNYIFNKNLVGGKTFNEYELGILNSYEKIFNFIINGNQEYSQIIYFPNLKKKTQYKLSTNSFKDFLSKGMSIEEMKNEFEKILQSKLIYSDIKSHNIKLQLIQKNLAVDFITQIFNHYKNDAYKYIETNGKEGINPSLINNYKIKSNLHKYSKFYSESLNLDEENGKKYYTKKDELIARAFEAYIKNKLDKLNYKNNFLVEDSYKENNIYPVDEELNELIILFDELFKNISEYINNIKYVNNNINNKN